MTDKLVFKLPEKYENTSIMKGGHWVNIHGRSIMINDDPFLDEELYEEEIDDPFEDVYGRGNSQIGSHEVFHAVKPEDDIAQKFLDKLSNYAEVNMKDNMIQLGNGDMRKLASMGYAQLQEMEHEINIEPYKYSVYSGFTLKYKFPEFELAKESIGNVRHFYFATNFADSISIISSGVKLNKTQGHVGGPLGNGIYFSDKPYVKLEGFQYAVLFVCDVALGKMLKVDLINHSQQIINVIYPTLHRFGGLFYSSDKPGYISPYESTYIKNDNGVGNTFAVYDPRQVKVRGLYLVKRNTLDIQNNL